MAESATVTRPETDTAQLAQDANTTAIAWLATEFPTWDITVDMTSGWNGVRREHWVAAQDGHHPQAALTAAKLHTRLDEYEDRARRRNAFSD